ncbi:MAG: hypothetical protein OEZ58_04615 [Gammaproteobacteria bacterium]|nr:hypothetical protein [Gammaproteobacteria bacterium]MDH5728247.1 hypothetical protein [Gammaproteobacteria bacterium]
MYLLFCPLVVLAETDNRSALTHGLGVSAGYILGSGLTYAHYLGPHILQTSFSGAKDRENSDFKLTLSYGRYLHQVQQPRSLVPLALKLFVGTEVRYQKGYISGDVIYEDLNRQGQEYFSHSGVGLALDIGNPGKAGLIVSLALSYALSIEQAGQQQEWEIGPLPGFSLLYSW